MKIAYIIFDGITWLDFIGVYDPVSRLKTLNYLPALTWDICSFTDTVADKFALSVTPTKIRQPLSGYDAIVIPGGTGTRKLEHDNEFLNWIRTAENARYKISVCSGSLILGAAGFLNNKRATTHFSEYDQLKNYSDQVVKERIVDDNNVITAGAVAASIDLGLYLCEKWSGKDAAAEIKRKMNYINK
jgi:transcriptional regulator GlxA family with amidase domain